MFGTMVHKNVKHKASWASKAMSGSQSVDPGSTASASGSLLEMQIIEPQSKLTVRNSGGENQ